MSDIERILSRMIADEVRRQLEPLLAEQHCPAPAEALLGVEEAARHLGVAPQTLYNWRSARTGPPAVRVGRLVRYRRDELDSWTRARSTARGTH